jgi:hypothetical protein
MLMEMLSPNNAILLQFILFWNCNAVEYYVETGFVKLVAGQ